MTNDLRVRPIETKDDPEMAFIIRSVLTEHGAARPGTVFTDPSTDHLTELFNRKGAFYDVALLAGELLGGCGIYPTPGLPAGCCELVKLYLLPAARGKGVGKRLMLACIEKAAAFGYRQIYLETMNELSTAVGLYEKIGFQYLETALGNSGHFGCDIWMLKTI